MFYTKKKAEKPYPLNIKPYRHPIKFLGVRLQLILTVALFTYLGVLIIAALYYLLFQTTHWTNDAWHNLVPDDTTRHNIRNVGEGLLGGLLGQALIWNHYKKRGKPKPWDKLEMKLGIPNIHSPKMSSPWVMALTPLLVLAYALPGFFLGQLFVNGLHHLWTWAATEQYNAFTLYTPNLADRFKGDITADYDQKLIGYFAAFVFGRHPAKGVMDDMQEYLVTYKICRGKTLHWYHSPTYKARFNELQAKGVDKEILGTTMTKVVIGAVIVGAILAVYGFFVLNWIAYKLVDQDVVNTYTNYVLAAVLGVLAVGLLWYTVGRWAWRRLGEVPI